MGQMALDEFISSALDGIISGVRKAQSINNTDAIICPGALVNNIQFLGVDGKGLVKDVVFDVAVTIDSAQESGAKIGVISGILSLGARSASKSAESQVNRLTFSVPLLLPCGDRKSASGTTGAMGGPD